LSRGYALEINFPIGRGFGMIASKKRLARILKPTSKEMERRTLPCSFKPRRENEMVPRVIVRGEPHSQVRRGNCIK
jgi:hypothetical protein